MNFSDFNDIGAMPQGKWYNRRTNQYIIIKDTFIDGDEGLKIITSEGNIIDGEILSREYIQCSEDVYDETGNIVGKSEIDMNEINDYQINNYQINDYQINDYQNYDFNPTKDIKKNSTNVQSINILPEPKNDINPMISKMFEKIKSKPETLVTIKWDNIPKDELKLLVKYFDVTEEDIARYIILEYVNEDNIIKNVSKEIKNMLK